uniref:Uncharacterized protein n=1 Tax=Ciona intestinalis TaxID=7719 RepID=F6ZSZ4_CIOIN
MQLALSSPINFWFNELTNQLCSGVWSSAALHSIVKLEEVGAENTSTSGCSD